MLWFVLFFLIPVVLVAVYSVGVLTLISYDQYLSIQAWRDFFHSSTYLGGPLGRGLFWKSMKMSLGVSITCVILAYPVAYMLALVAGRRKYTLLLVIITPFLTSYLLARARVAGAAQSAGRDPGGASRSRGGASRTATVPWLTTPSSRSTLVLAYAWVPFVALPIFVSLESLDLQMLEASSDLGASRWTTFRKVTLPMSTPGVIAAFVFVFIPTIGEYVTPQIVGGKGGYLFGNVIQSSFSASFDWQLGSAMSVFLLVGRRDPARDLRPVPQRADGGRMNPAISTGGRRTLWVMFWFLVVFLYAPIVVLIIFSFNDSEIVSFPWLGFTTKWYHEFLANPALLAALKHEPAGRDADGDRRDRARDPGGDRAGAAAVLREGVRVGGDARAARDPARRARDLAADPVQRGRRAVVARTPRRSATS